MKIGIESNCEKTNNVRSKVILNCGKTNNARSKVILCTLHFTFTSCESALKTIHKLWL